MSLNRTLPRFKGIENVPAGALLAIVQVSDSLGIDPDWLASIIKFESGFNPKAVNVKSGATGAIQFMPPTAKNLGTTVAAIKDMSLEAQIRGPVYQYFLPAKGKMKSLEDAYLVVFYPKAIGQSLDYVVGSKSGDAYSQKVYAQNSGFDRGGKGYITKGDITGTIRAVYNSAKGVPRFPVSGAPFLGSPVGTFLLLAGFIGASYAIVSYGITGKTPYRTVPGKTKELLSSATHSVEKVF